ncbi:hypothetical protein FOBRF1_006516 [Fusarium oxysporum]
MELTQACSFLGRWIKWALSVPDGVLPRQLPKQRLGATGRTAAQVLMASIGLHGATSWAVEGIRRRRTSQGTAYGNVSSVSAIHGRKRRTPRSEVAHPLSEGVAPLLSGLLRLTEQRQYASNRVSWRDFALRLDGASDIEQIVKGFVHGAATEGRWRVTESDGGCGTFGRKDSWAASVAANRAQLERVRRKRDKTYEMYGNTAHHISRHAFKRVSLNSGMPWDAAEQGGLSCGTGHATLRHVSYDGAGEGMVRRSPLPVPTSVAETRSAAAEPLGSLVFVCFGRERDEGAANVENYRRGIILL